MKEPGSSDATEEAPRRARLFWNGRSQAVRLPKEFRFEGDEVEIRREGDAVVLKPVRRQGWPEGYWEWLDGLRGDLDIPDIEPMPVKLLDVDLDFEPE